MEILINIGKIIFVITGFLFTLSIAGKIIDIFLPLDKRKK